MVEAEVFHMLVERLGNVEDALGRMESYLKQTPCLSDLKPEHVRKAAAEKADQVLLDQMLGNATFSGAHLCCVLYTSQIETLKRNGFRVFERKQYLDAHVCWGTDVQQSDLEAAGFVQL